MNTRRPEATVVVEREWKIDPTTLWDLWTTKQGFESWWGPEGLHATVQELNLKEGGELRFELTADSASERAALESIGRPSSHPTSARYVELKPGERVVLRVHVDFIPGVRPYDNDLTADFTKNGDKTRMRVTQEAMHTDELTKMSKEGLESQLAKLDQRFR